MKAYVDSLRFKSRYRYTAERFGQTSLLVARQVFDLDTGQLVQGQVPTEFHEALLGALQSASRDLLATLPEDARRIEGRLREIDGAHPEVEPFSLWHLMIANLEVGLARDLTSPDNLAGVAVQAAGSALIILAVLDLVRNEDEAVTWLRVALGRPESATGIQARMRVFAELLPKRILQQVDAG